MELLRFMPAVRAGPPDLLGGFAGDVTVRRARPFRDADVVVVDLGDREPGDDVAVVDPPDLVGSGPGDDNCRRSRRPPGSIPRKCATPSVERGVACVGVMGGSGMDCPNAPLDAGGLDEHVSNLPVVDVELGGDVAVTHHTRWYRQHHDPQLHLTASHMPIAYNII